MSIDWTSNWPDDPYWLSGGGWDWRPPWVRPARPGTIRWALSRTIAPATEPISLAETKLHLRVDITDDDSYISDVITAAREYVEVLTGYSLLTQTWVLNLANWPRTDRVEYWPWVGRPTGSILLPRTPVQSVTSVAWTGADASQNTVPASVYQVNLTAQPPRIALAPNQNWPSPTLTSTNGVQVTFVSGYTAATAVPRTLRQALYLMVGHWYRNREEVLTGTRLVALELPKAASALLGIYQPSLVG